jgi:hypothetical protein
MLLRRWINASFRLLARSAWNPLIVQRYLTILVDPATGPLTYENPRTPVSLAWHLADIWVDELNKVLGDEEIVRFRSPIVPPRLCNSSRAATLTDGLLPGGYVGTSTSPNVTATIHTTPHTDKQRPNTHPPPSSNLRTHPSRRFTPL